MTTHEGEHDVVRALAAADAASPPPPGTAWSGASLRAAAVRRTRRQLALAAGVLALAAFAASFATAVAPRGDRGDADGERQRADLRADLETLRAWLAVRPSPDEGERRLAAAADLRYELANARANAVLAAAPLSAGKNR